MVRLVIVLNALWLLNCASQKAVLMEEPRPGQTLLVGAVLVENDGMDDVTESKTANIMVIVVGQSAENKVTKGYRLKTDRNGYFFLPNVPGGSYVLKGIEVDVGYTKHLLLSSRWEGNRQVFVQESGIIDYTVRIWPPAATEKIVDFQINYFKIDRTGRIYSNTFPQLLDKMLGLQDKRYTMANPRDYYKKSFPDSRWFE